MSDRLAVMSAGRIEQVGTPERGLREPGDRVRRRLPRRLEPDGRRGDRVATRRRAARCASATSRCAPRCGDVGARGAVKIVARPERVALLAHGSERRQRLPGMVERTVYVGASLQVIVRLATGATRAGVGREHRRPTAYRRGRRSPCTCRPTRCACSPVRRRRRRSHVDGDEATRRPAGARASRTSLLNSRRERRRAAGRQARMRLRRVRRRRQDDERRGDRARDGCARREGRGRHDRPAKRLANALGLEELENEPRRVPARAAAGRGLDGQGRAVGDDARPEADIRRADRRIAPDPERAEEIKANRVYGELSTAVSGSQEFTAIAKLYELDQEGQFDLLVLDTPPSRNALDFLDAPGPADVVSRGRALKAFLRPTGIGMRVSGRARRRCWRRCGGSPGSTC